MTELGFVVAGALIVLAAVAWWYVHRARQRSVLLRGISDADPAVRRAAVAIAVDEGLADRYADQLGRAARQDPVVHDALADAFRAAPWQASGGPGATRLRLQVERDHVDLGAGAADAARDAQPPVLVTGAGGAAGVAVLNALRPHRRTVGADADETAAGLQLADVGSVLPRGDDPAFVGELVALARRTGARTVVCTVAEEMVAVHDGAALLEANGLRTWLAPREAILDCIDKWRFAQRCEAAALPVPRTALGEIGDVPGPWIVKPRFGRGSRDVVAASTPDEVRAALDHVPEPIVQTRLDGREFTVDALVETGGRLVCVVPRWRLETKGGISTKGRTFADRALTADVARLVATLGLEGAVNVQGFVGADGRALFTEVNPRFSGGLPLSVAAGADLVGEFVHRVEGGEIRVEHLAPRADVTMARYFAEVYPS